VKVDRQQTADPFNPSALLTYGHSAAKNGSKTNIQ